MVFEQSDIYFFLLIISHLQGKYKEIIENSNVLFFVFNHYKTFPTIEKKTLYEPDTK